MSEPTRSHRYEITTHIEAPRDVVWDLLHRNDRYSDWTSLTTSFLEVEGDGDPNGVGAIRVLGRAGRNAREQVVGFEAPSYFAYTILSGLPLHDYLAEVRLTESASGGTDVVWTGAFNPPAPWQGAVWAWMVKHVFVGQIVRALAKEAPRRASFA